MTAKELELRWQTISQTGIKIYRSLLLSSDSIPDLYIAKDVLGNRCLILQTQSSNQIDAGSSELQHLSLDIQYSEHRIVISLRTSAFNDVFNDLIISLYNRVKSMQEPKQYIEEFTSAFHKWTQFFDDSSSSLLSKDDVQGLFGELIVLRHFLQQRITNADNLLLAWQGPYGRAQDFTFPNYDLEVKTRNADQALIRISSEYQLQPSIGKELQLGIITVRENADGLNLEELSDEIKMLIVSAGGDISLYLETMLRAGISGKSNAVYSSYRWQPLELTLYNGTDNNAFPKIIASNIAVGITGVKYQIPVALLDAFIISNLQF